MRVAAIACLVGVGGLAQQPPAELAVPIGVWYGGPGIHPPEVARAPWAQADAWRRDLDAIRAAGFTSVTTWTSWRHAEPIQGRYRFDAMQQMLRLAGESRLRVALEVFAEPAPAWHAGPACSLDSPIVRLLTAANTRALPHESFDGIGTALGPGAGECPGIPRLTPKPAGAQPMSPAELSMALDLLRAPAGPRSWRLARLQVAADTSDGARGPDVTDADVRLWTWAALSRGARGVAFDGWHAMTEPDGAPTRVARAAGAVAANIARNARLFSSVVPRQARVALLYTGAAPPSSRLYRAAFDRNIAVDLVLPGDLLSGAASRYRILLAEAEQPDIVRQAMKVFELAGGRILDDPAALAGIPPDIRIDGAPGLVEARLLESPDAWLLIAINHAGTPQTVRLAFGTDIPEAIWVDLDTGNSVSFVQSPAGPMLSHTFPPRDVLLLVRSKRLR